MAGILPRARIRTTHSDKRGPQGGELGAFPRHTSGASYRVREESHGVQEPASSHPTSAGPPTSSSLCRTPSRPRVATVAARAPLRRSLTLRRTVRLSDCFAFRALLMHPSPPVARTQVQDIVADFDDPNIDKDAIIFGACHADIGVYAYALTPSPFCVSQRTTLHTPRSALRSPTRTTRACPRPRCACG